MKIELEVSEKNESPERSKEKIRLTPDDWETPDYILKDIREEFDGFNQPNGKENDGYIFMFCVPAKS